MHPAKDPKPLLELQPSLLPPLERGAELVEMVPPPEREARSVPGWAAGSCGLGGGQIWLWLHSLGAYLRCMLGGLGLEASGPVPSTNPMPVLVA